MFAPAYELADSERQKRNAEECCAANQENRVLSFIEDGKKEQYNSDCHVRS